MCEAHRYEQWSHIAYLRRDILTVFQFGKHRKKYKLEELHPMEMDRRRAKITMVDFKTAAGIFVK